MLLHPAHLERDVDPEKLENLTQMANGYVHENGDETDCKDHWTGARTGSPRPHLSTIQNGTTNGSDVTEFLLSKVLTPEKVKPPAELVAMLCGLGKLGEWLFVARPLLYGM